MGKRFVAGTMAAVTAMSAFAPAMTITAHASSTYEMRRKIVVTSGIMDSSVSANANNTVTRSEFAKMLVKASSYKDVSTENTTALYNDVAADAENAAYIRIAAENGWMSGFLGGYFKPDDPVNVAQAAKATLTLLGYTDSDFTGNLVANQIAKYQAIGLDEEISKAATDTLTYSDCVNLFYNLLDTNTADYENDSKTSSTIYGALFGYEVNDDGDLNPFASLEDDLKGPYVLKKGSSVGSILPFSKNSASYYLNGVESSRTEIEDTADDDTVIIYYNPTTKMVYAYSSEGGTDSEGNSTIGAAEGELTSIYYGSSDVMTPTSIVITDEDGDETEYVINTSDMQYAFSVYGDVEVNDDVTIIWEVQTIDDEEQYVVIDLVE